MSRIVIALFFALFMASPSHAQEISKSKLTAIGELLDISGTDAVLDAQIDTITKEILKLTLEPLKEKITQKGVDYLTQKIVEKFKTSKGDYYWRAAAVYDKYFTHDEILEMIDWYKTPLGEKMIKVLPKLSIELSEAGRRWGEEVGIRATKEFIEEIKANKKTTN